MSALAIYPAYAQPHCSLPEKPNGSIHHIANECIHHGPHHFLNTTLKLSEEQENQIFLLRHQSVPILRDIQQKIIKLQDAHAELITNRIVSEERLREHAITLGKMYAELLFHQSMLDAKIYQLLNDEQRHIIKNTRTFQSPPLPLHGIHPPMN